MKQIFTALLKNKFSDPSIETRRFLNAISLGFLDVFKFVSTLFLPTPSKLHYLFSMHDIKKVCFKFLHLFVFELLNTY